ncbi:LytR/AlgR family response regulator transcription factor [Alterisphingorhabdus coralli]|uniref:LytTR family DNA-binding domain-containing protein n=1 Tax=Alterisphingorhabdus coralli TaxID=3071408 RepID=A0AA97I0A4_9SPHN|nr:LytTR family DNA-binding domain-containing protein [Parasphingorhabdus sp. SCSIO 66989]WOE75529.1 LytTR family DNA-binding domain-containing protein [Parasphingorhabdus sp. SCSIO 66989]
MTIRIAIADDEALSRDLLATIFDEITADVPGLKLVSQTATGEETVAAIAAERPDIVFLDINMPAGDGFSVVSALEEMPFAERPKVIFTTAYSRFAVQAFDVEAADYLLKPISAERVIRAIERVTRSRDSDADRQDGRVAVPSGKGTDYIALTDIEYARAESEYIALYVGGQKRMLRGSLKSFAQELPSGFCQVHRSYIANAAYVLRLEKSDQGGSELCLSSGRAIPVSRRFRSKTMAWLDRSGIM